MPFLITGETSLIHPTTSKHRHFCAYLRFLIDRSQDGTSEGFIGEWAEKRGIRDQLVISTKVIIISSPFVLPNDDWYPRIVYCKLPAWK